jgi:hypothetical protein
MLIDECRRTFFIEACEEEEKEGRRGDVVAVMVGCA